MDFAFFESLTETEALAFLENYRTAGADGRRDLENLVHARRGASLDFSVGSVRTAFEVLAVEVETIPTAKDESLPDWISNSESYRPGLYDFDDASAVWVLRLSFYVAEALLRNSGGALHWGVGDRDTAQQSQPVLVGFKAGVQMAPLLVTENLLRRLIAEPDPSASDDVDRALQTWRGLIDVGS